MSGHRVLWFPPDRPVEGNTVYVRQGVCPVPSRWVLDELARELALPHGYPGWCPGCRATAWCEACAVGMPECGHGCHCVVDPLPAPPAGCRP